MRSASVDRSLFARTSALAPSDSSDAHCVTSANRCSTFTTSVIAYPFFRENSTTSFARSESNTSTSWDVTPRARVNALRRSPRQSF